MDTRNVLSHADAAAIVAAVRSELEERALGAAVAVCDEHGELIAFLRTDGCRLPSIGIAMNKAYTAAREKTASKVVGDASREDDFPMTNFGELRYVSWGGGVPLVHGGNVVGAVGVSGLPEAQDIELAEFAVEVFRNLTGDGDA